jgi:lysophospholipase L1-like esterase
MRPTLLPFLFFISGHSFAQAPLPTNATTFENSFINQILNVIENGAVLQPLTEKIQALKRGENATINIVHIGDSHIQADWLTERVRELLQKKYGDAGRGLIVPCRVAGTNEPTNFRTSGIGNWSTGRVIVPNGQKIGIGALTVRSAEPTASLTVSSHTHDLTKPLFQEVQVFCDKQNAYDLSIKDALGNTLQTVASDDATQTNDYFSFMIKNLPSSAFTLQSKANANGNQTTIYGINITNLNAGVRYHAIGINGATFQHYNQAKLLAKQLFFLKPDLVIVGLGTNEAQKTVVKDVQKAQILQLVTQLKNETQAPLLLYSPADSYRKGAVNPDLSVVTTALKEVATEQNLAFWDLYTLSGGKGSALQWRTRGLLSKDGVHYAKKGYYLQGETLFQALEKLW